MSFGADLSKLIETSSSPLLGVAPSWSRTMLGAVANIVNGFPFPSKGFNGKSGHPIIRIRDVTSGRTSTYFKGEAPEGFWVENGDVLVGMDGDFNIRLWEGGRALLNQRVCKIAVNHMVYDKTFLVHLLPAYLSVINSATSSITVKHLSSRTIAQIPLPFPPLDEQKRIVSRLDSLQSHSRRAREALEKIPDLIEKFRQSVLAAAFRGDLTKEWREKNKGKIEPASELLKRIRIERRRKWEEEQLKKFKAAGKTPKDDSWKAKYKEPEPVDSDGLPELPEGWVWANSAEICEKVDAGSTPPANLMKSGAGDIPFIKVYNLCFDGRLDFTVNPTFVSHKTHAEKLGRSIVLPGDVLMNIVGPPLGKVSIVPDSYPEWNHNQAIVSFRPLALNNRILAYYLMSPLVLRKFNLDSQATAGQYNISVSGSRELAVPVPPPEEQKEIQLIVDKAYRLSSTILELARSSSNSYLTLDQSILGKAFRGELVPQGPNDQPSMAKPASKVTINTRKSERDKKQVVNKL